MKEKRLLCKQIREEKGMNKSDVARKTGIQQGVIGWIESCRFIPYDSQLKKIANALDWDGDPQELLKEVEA